VVYLFEGSIAQEFEQQSRPLLSAGWQGTASLVRAVSVAFLIPAYVFFEIHRHNCSIMHFLSQLNKGLI
jgi:hypothetical protein